ncbi:hypothetical protein XBP1_2210010 [Xenorhabdus bovienii str. puntauvense]|uniref:Uncharacterized protein n=3 Tax=Xenorhabdus bovienii TaxID=40576 RepID=A0A0B6XE83_XENBV|nr:hypothetical protein XBP1_2210010 [Xenorhabdus bovienii str. puntauvense]CDH22307.1 hypothetical protein XBKB1_1070001 [Xenorhabdus bovienii str. kraussei Becker Underwood]CDM91471.1 protein of unknown function [Xenorhabdus bovienii]
MILLDLAAQRLNVIKKSTIYKILPEARIVIWFYIRKYETTKSHLKQIITKRKYQQ